MVASARNNARWCHQVALTNGLTGRFTTAWWSSPRRTPAWFPDAVTLSARVAVGELLTSVDNSEDCSIKDSFCSLDLFDAGFDVIVEAYWIWRPPRAAAPSEGISEWHVVPAERLGAWEHSWSPDGSTGTFAPALLDGPITVLGEERDGRYVAGAVLTDSDGVVGLSNVFGPDDDSNGTWRSCLATVDRLCPGRPVAGYESGASLSAARAHGFETIGPVRVWQR